MSKICSLLDGIFGWAVRFASQVDTLKTINIFRIDQSSVWLDMKGNRRVYGFKVESKDNTIVRFGKQFSSILPSIRYIESPDVVMFFVNKENHQAIYFYAFDERIVNQLCRDTRSPAMTGDEIVASLFDGLLAQKYKLEQNRLIQTGFASNPFIPYGLEMASGKFRAKAEVAVDNIMRDYNIYQGVEYSNVDEFNPVELFKARWDGSIMLWFNFSAAAAESRVRLYEATARFGDKVFAAECSAITDKTDDEMLKIIKENSYIINSVAVLKDEASKPEVEAALKIVFEKNYLTGPSIIAKTILLTRDSDFDAILPSQALLKYFSSAHKRETPKGLTCDFSGIDICGNIVDYSFKNNNNPHCILTGVTGSGKSVQAIGVLEGVLGYSHDTKKAKNIDKINVRYCDVGYTSGRFIKDLQNAHPNDVEIFGSNVGGLRFGLFDFDTVDGMPPDEELDFLMAFMSFALDIDGAEPLSGIEQSYVKKAIKDMYRKKSFSDLYVQDLYEDGGYAKVIDDILSDGYTLKSKASSLPAKYDFLKKPILRDLMSGIELEAHSGDAKEIDKQVYDSILMKLKMLNENKMINKYSNVDLSTSKAIFHIDFDEIKNNERAFNISYWMIMKKWLKSMKAKALKRFDAGQEPDTTFFFIEEAHNFFKYKTFADMLTTAAKEIRKFGGRLFFITQDIEDLPEKVYQELSTKIFIASAAEKERYKAIAKKVYPQAIMEPINEVIDRLEDRMLLILSDSGVIGCKLQLGGDILYYKPLKI